MRIFTSLLKCGFENYVIDMCYYVFVGRATFAEQLHIYNILSKVVRLNVIDCKRSLKEIHSVGG